jgi:chromosome segregation ATPase
VDTVATLDPVGALRMTALCLDGLYHLQTFQSQATAQLVDQAQALHLTVQLRDGQLREASDELESRGALITQLQSEVQVLQDTVMDRDTTLHFLEDQFHDLQLDLDDAQGQLHQMQDALHAPPGEMQADGEEEPQEIQGVSEMDFEEQAPQPAPVETHSPAASEASVNM